MKNRVSSDLIWGLLSALLIFGVFILTLWGNSNNLDPRYLFIDEQITFYPVAKILNPSGLDEFLWLISDQWPEHVKDQKADEKTNVLG
jgi:hypothetical protein